MIVIAAVIARWLLPAWSEEYWMLVVLIIVGVFSSAYDKWVKGKE